MSRGKSPDAALFLPRAANSLCRRDLRCGPHARGDTLQPVNRFVGYGGVIRELRQARGLSQEELAERAGVGHRTIVRLEAEERTPKLDIVDKVLVALDVGLDEFSVAIRNAQASGLVAEPTPPYPDVSRPALDPLDALLESAVASLSGLVAAVKERDRKM